MTYRQGEDTLIGKIKGLGRRVDKLETGRSNHRRNDVRIGNLLMTWDDAGANLQLRNLATGGPIVNIPVP